MVQRLASAKAQALADRYPRHLMIGSDQRCVFSWPDHGQAVNRSTCHCAAHPRFRQSGNV
ncbi:MAG: 7-methyl-GTP pyrophosphatase [Sodalis sp.]|nr:MAG: 7-methyl-GTP pyrophosphatase [Sodalis sp.]